MLPRLKDLTPPARPPKPFVERALARVFPGWALKREIARLRLTMIGESRRFLSTYEAAEKSRLTDDWPSKTKSADAAIGGDYWTILSRARGAARDSWAAVSIADGYVRHVVGKGITARANARNPETNASLDIFNRAADREWARWSTRPELCDSEGTKTFVGIEALCAREMTIAGEAFVVISYEPRDGDVGLVLQMVEPEQFDTSITQYKDPATGVTREVKAGIELDDRGRAVAYHVYQAGHPLDAWGKWRSSSSARVPASRVIHLMRQDRVRQSHGVSRLTPVLREMYHTRMYEEYTLLRARFEACGGAAITSEPGASPLTMEGLNTGASSDALDANSNTQFNMEPNMVWQLPAGKKVEFLAPQTPGGQYEPFTRAQMKKIAAGAGLDYPTVSRDFSGNTYSGQRQGMIETWGETDAEQLRMMNVLCRRVWEAFITYAVLEGRLAAPLWAQPLWRRAYLEATWQAPPKEWIDPNNQANAVKSMVDYRIKPRRDIYNELGQDWKEAFTQIAEEERFAASLNVKLPDAGGAPAPAPAPPMRRFEAVIPGNGNGRNLI